MTDHLCREFASIAPDEVVSAVTDARAQIEIFSLDASAAIDTAELMVRARMMQDTDQLRDNARERPRTRTVPGARSPERR